MKFKKVKFKEKEYFLITGSTKDRMPALATKKQYENGEISFGSIDSNGDIIRFGEVIGTKKDLEAIGEEDLEYTKEAMANVIDLIFSIWD